MELEFKRKNLPYLKQIVREVLYQEELSEIIVPDSLPDVGNIVESFAIPIVRGKESRNGSTTISGGIKGEVIYNPEDLSAPKTLDAYIPFNVKLDHPQLTEESRTLCSVQIRSVDCRILNSRKVLLRVNIACMLLALAHQEEVLFEPQAIPDDLQVKQVEYACKIPVEYAEKSFVVSDSLAIPSGSPPIDRVIRTACLLEVADSKSIANKGVFKGTVYCKVLYQSIDGQICSHEQKLPFSQFCEFAP